MREAAITEGVLRYELVARSPVLRERKLDRLGDLNPDRLLAMNAHYFQRAGFDAEVGGINRVKQVGHLAEAAGVGKEMAKVRQMLMTEALGLPPTQCERTRGPLKRLARQYGLTPGDFLVLDKVPVRLDYLAGTVMSPPTSMTDTPAGAW
jgi:hypothetical protein